MQKPINNKTVEILKENDTGFFILQNFFIFRNQKYNSTKQQIDIWNHSQVSFHVYSYSLLQKEY